MDESVGADIVTGFLLVDEPVGAEIVTGFLLVDEPVGTDIVTGFLLVDEPVGADIVTGEQKTAPFPPAIIPPELNSCGVNAAVNFNYGLWSV